MKQLIEYLNNLDEKVFGKFSGLLLQLKELYNQEYIKSYKFLKDIKFFKEEKEDITKTNNDYVVDIYNIGNVISKYNKNTTLRKSNENVLTISGKRFYDLLFEGIHDVHHYKFKLGCKFQQRQYYSTFSLELRVEGYEREPLGFEIDTHLLHHLNYEDVIFRVVDELFKAFETNILYKVSRGTLNDFKSNL